MRDFLYQEVIALNLSLNVPRMAPNQAIEAVNLIMGDADYMNLKPEDFRVCFERVRKGAYDKSYNRVDVQVIFEWLNAYCADREDAIIAHNRDKKTIAMTFPKEPLPPIFSEETKARIAAIGNPKESEPVKRQRIRADDYHDEFDSLIKKQDARRVPGPVFVEYKQQLLDRQEYINLRSEEDANK